MRNHDTDVFGDQITTEYKESGLTPEEFVTLVGPTVFDTRFSPDEISCNYIEAGACLTIYYNYDRDTWFVKF